MQEKDENIIFRTIKYRKNDNSKKMSFFKISIFNHQTLIAKSLRVDKQMISG